MAEWVNNEIQVVEPGESVVFSIAAVPYLYGMIYHRDGSGVFRLRGFSTSPFIRNAKYSVRFGANIAIPTGGTVGPISIALSQDGEEIPTSEAIVTPAAVEEYNNVNVFADITFPLWAPSTVSVRNTSTQAIEVQNANITINPNNYVRVA